MSTIEVGRYYKYEAFRGESKYIRVLRIRPSACSDILEKVVEFYSVHFAPEFNKINMEINFNFLELMAARCEECTEEEFDGFVRASHERLLEKAQKIMES